MKEPKEILKLVKRAKAQEPDAFTELMQFYMKDMYRVSAAILMNDEDAADAIQDTILACWEKIGTLRENRFFKSWMTRILIRKCYDILNHRRSLASLEEYKEPEAQETPEDGFHEMLSILDEKYRVPMMLYYGLGYKTSEIAELLHIPRSTVQTRLARGREKLADFYKSERK